MPRKENYGFDYDDYDDGYDDYDENYEDGYVGEEGKKDTSQPHKEIKKTGLWQCSFCTSENEESLLSCDICGVFRDSFKINGTTGEEEVHVMHKNTEASVMAKSLFGQLSRRSPKTFCFIDEFIGEERSCSSEKGKKLLTFDDFQKAFMAPQNYSLNIAPFQFDTLSPDDVIFSWKNSSRIGSKDHFATNSVLSDSAMIPTSLTRKPGIVKFLPKKESDCESTSVSKSDHPYANKNSFSKLGNGASDFPSTSGSVSYTPNESSRQHFEDNNEESRILAGDFRKLKLGKNSTQSRKAKSLSEYKPEKWMSSDQDKEKLYQLNLAIVGHVDSGKSTLSGRLLHLLGRVAKKEMHKFEKVAKEKGKGSFAYAWAMDESSEERERGITMTVAIAYFDTKKYHVVVLDSPGHRDFVPNMISGATQADVAILVVDASVGAFEAGMDGNGYGQTKEHAQLIRSFGVEQIIVAVNKMDVVEFSSDRFEFIKLQLGAFLRSCGFKESSVMWVPLSAMDNQNLVASAVDVRLTAWYRGDCLLDAIDSLKPPVRDVSKPLVLPICDVTRSHSLGQVAASGKLETGAIQNGSKVLIMPFGDLATIRSIERDSRACSVARAGDNVAVTLQGVDMSHLAAGGVLCHPDYPVSVSSSLELKVLVLDVASPIFVGAQVEIHIQHVKEAARVVKVVSLVGQKTGKITKKAPRFLTAKQSAIIEVAIDSPICVEEFSRSRALGRAFIRASRQTIAVGIVTRLLDQES